MNKKQREEAVQVLPKDGLAHTHQVNQIENEENKNTSNAKSIFSTPVVAVFLLFFPAIHFVCVFTLCTRV